MAEKAKTMIEPANEPGVRALSAACAASRNKHFTNTSINDNI